MTLNIYLLCIFKLVRMLLENSMKQVYFFFLIRSGIYLQAYRATTYFIQSESSSNLPRQLSSTPTIISMLTEQEAGACSRFIISGVQVHVKETLT